MFEQLILQRHRRIANKARQHIHDIFFRLFTHNPQWCPKNIWKSVQSEHIPYMLFVYPLFDQPQFAPKSRVAVFYHVQRVFLVRPDLRRAAVGSALRHALRGRVLFGRNLHGRCGEWLPSWIRYDREKTSAHCFCPCFDFREHNWRGFVIAALGNNVRYFTARVILWQNMLRPAGPSGSADLSKTKCAT